MATRSLSLVASAALLLVACGGDGDGAGPQAHRQATDALFAVLDRVVATLQQVADGNQLPGEARQRLAALRGELDAAVARRRQLGPAQQPESLQHYVALEPRRKAQFEEFNRVCLRLEGQNELLKAAQALAFEAVRWLVAEPG